MAFLAIVPTVATAMAAATHVHMHLSQPTVHAEVLRLYAKREGLRARLILALACH
jgi:hypothetical protein